MSLLKYLADLEQHGGDPDRHAKHVDLSDAAEMDPDAIEAMQALIEEQGKAAELTRIFPTTSLEQAGKLGFKARLGKEGAINFTISGDRIAASDEYFHMVRETRLQTTRPLIGDPHRPEVFYEHLFDKAFSKSELKALERILQFGYQQHLLQFKPDGLPEHVAHSIRNPWFSTVVDLEQLYARKLKQLIGLESLLIQKERDALADMPKSWLLEDVNILRDQTTDAEKKFRVAEANCPIKNGKYILNTDALILKRDWQKLQQQLSETQNALNTPKSDRKKDKDPYVEAEREYQNWLGLVPELLISETFQKWKKKHQQQRAERAKLESNQDYKFIWFAKRIGFEGMAALALRDYVRTHKDLNPKKLAAQLEIDPKQAERILANAQEYNKTLENVETVPSKDFVKDAGFSTLYQYLREGNMDRLLNTRIQATEKPDVVDYVIELAASLAHVTQIPLELAIAPRKSIARAEQKIAQDGDVNDLHRFSIIVDDIDDVERIFQTAFDDEATMVMEIDDKFNSRPGGYYARHFRICQITGKRGQYPIEFKIITREAHFAQQEYGHPFYELRRTLGKDEHSLQLKTLLSKYERQLFEIAWYNDGLKPVDDILMSPMPIVFDEGKETIHYPELRDVYQSLRKEVVSLTKLRGTNPAALNLIHHIDETLQSLSMVQRTTEQKDGAREWESDPEERMLARIEEREQTLFPTRRRSHRWEDSEDRGRPEFNIKSGHAAKAREASGVYERSRKFRHVFGFQHS